MRKPILISPSRWLRGTGFWIKLCKIPSIGSEADSCVRAHRHQSAVIQQYLQAMAASLETISIQMDAGMDKVQEMQQSLTKHRRGGRSDPPRPQKEAHSSNDEPNGRTSGAVELPQKRRFAQVPGACPMPCYCRCHRAILPYWTSCNYKKCRRKIQRQGSVFRLNLRRWLIGYSVSFSISASPRPQGQLPVGDIRLRLLARLQIDKETALRYFHKTHPRDLALPRIPVLLVRLLNPCIAGRRNTSMPKRTDRSLMACPLRLCSITTTSSF